MRLLNLQLTAFGPFTDRTLELNPEARFHLVYGPNESGKSSTLRALRVLLYGFARQTTENFLHSSQNLKVGGRFLNGSGEPIELVRLKRNKKSLVSPQGEPVEDSTLERLLGGLSPEMFDRLYGLSHSNLVSGGKALIQVGGKVGESLFAASLGPEYQNLVNDLRKEHEAIWTSRSSAKPLDEWIRRWEDADAQSRAQALSADSWIQSKDELARSVERSRQLKLEFARLDTQREKKQRLLKAAPDVARRKELLEKLAGFGELPELSEEFAARRLAVQTELAVAEKRCHSLEAEQSELTAALEELGANEEILDYSSRVVALFQRVAVITEHALEGPQVEAELSACRRSIEKLLASLGHSQASSKRPALPSGGWRAEARKKAQQYLRLDSALKESEKRLEAVEQALRAVEVVEADGSAQMKSRLEQALQLARHEVGLDETVVKLLSELRTAGSALRLELEKLPCWNGELDALIECRVPSHSMVEEYERTLSEAERDLRRRRADLLEKRRQLQSLEGELESYTSGHNLFTLDDLYGSRKERDELWSDIYHAWMEGDTPQEVGDLVKRYSGSVKDTDQMADEIIASGEQLVQLEHLKSRTEKERELLLRLEEKVAEQESVLSRQEQDWRALWQDTGVLLGAPRQMLSWLSQREEILRQAKRIEHRESELQKTQEHLRKTIDKLNQVVVECGIEPFNSDQGLIPALAVVEQRVEELRRLLVEREAAEEKRRDLKRQRAEHAQRKESLKGELEQWEEEWRELLLEYPFTPAPRPEGLEDLLIQLEELTSEMSGESRLLESSRRIEAELSAFRAEAEQLRDKVNADPEWTEVMVVEAAQRELRDAQQHRQERERLQRELLKKSEQHALLQEEVSAGKASLELLMREAGVESADQLPKREKEVRKKRELEKELALVESSLRNLSAGESLADFCSSVENADLDRLPGELELLREEMSRLSEEREREVNRTGQLQARLERLDGTSLSAKLGQEAATAEAKGRELLERYVRLVLAERLLTDQMEHYRKQNEGPVLERAGYYFQRLTDGRYRSLQTGFDRKGGDLVLQAVSESSREVPVDGLSDGTRDQLFLALRLATISRSADTGGPLPVVADDVLVHFDDRRAASTLKTLVEFSETTQVVLFSHLERDLELARGLGDQRVDIVELPGLSL